MKITPSPRILKMLGQIEFQEWQCLAELIDNSIDDLRQINGADAVPSVEDDSQDFCIQILLPSSSNNLAENSVEVRDRGRGMDEEQLRMAVRAGWSGNDMFDRLGLFGMGFNVATARLGRVTRVLTTRAGDPEWVGVEIDLDAIGLDFDAKDIREPKADPGEHGTRVTVFRLDQMRADTLHRKQDALRTKLGHIYSWLLENTAISIRINGKRVRPKRHCVWAENRSVVYGKGRSREVIPAVIPIDEPLPLAEACGSCGNWQQPGLTACNVCGAETLMERERRIHGWVGIQRYLDQTEFGLDFLRNGRKIRIYDKSVFEWIDPNSPDAVTETEYPVEVPPQGRIVGEIHLDHVPVHYMKDRFDTTDRSWRSAIEFLRGPGPLKPERAKKLGFPAESNAPIAKLFRGYRRTDPGKRCLIPGDGKSAIHQRARDWAKKFQRGDKDYQSDEKWWEAVEFHEREAEKENSPAPPTGGETDVDAIIEALSDGSENDDGSSGTNEQAGIASSGSESTTERPATLNERVQHLYGNSSEHPGLTRALHSRLLGEDLEVSAREISNSPLVDPNSGMHTALWLHPVEGGRALLFIDPKHEAFSVQGVQEIDLALAQIANFMLARADNRTYTIAQIVHELRRDCFPDNNVDFQTVQQSARDIVARVRESIQNEVADDPERAWGVLSSDEVRQIENSVALYSGATGALSSEDTTFIEHTPASYLVRLFEEWPESFTDGRIFKFPYAALSDETAKSLAKSRIASLLLDVATLAGQEVPSPSMNYLRRARLSAEILVQEFSD